MVATKDRVVWVVLVHRMPRQPSTARIAVWRRLKALGVAQIADGVVALPEDARSREHLEWVADQVIQGGGTALLLRAQTLSASDERRLAAGMADARAGEYRTVTIRARAALEAGESGQKRELQSLRRVLRAVQRRDYFPPPERDAARLAVDELAALVADATPVGGGRR